MPHIIKKEKATTEQLMVWLSRSNTAFSDLILSDIRYSLDPWQKSYLANESKIISILKGRRVGGSFIMALKMYIRAITIPYYNATIVSMNLEEARGKIEYIESFYDETPASFRLKLTSNSKDEISFIDSKNRKSSIRSLASKAPRGRGGDVGISELSHCQNAKDIYEGALHVTARNKDDKMTIESTPLGKNDIFHDISFGKYHDISRYEIPWWISTGLCNDIYTASKEAKVLSTRERVEKYGNDSLKSIYNSMDEEIFKRESELSFQNSESGIFRHDLILSAIEPDFSEDDQSFRFRFTNNLPDIYDWEWLSKSSKGRLIAGFDPARKIDSSSLVILDDDGKRLETRFIASFKNQSFRKQKEILKAAINFGVKVITIDSNGIGLNLSEELSLDHPANIIAFTFTSKSKEQLIFNALDLFREKKIRLAAFRELIDQLSSIKQIITDHGSIIYKSERDSDSHQDIAWSFLLSLWSEKSGQILAYEPSYESLSKRTVNFGF